MQAQCPSCKLPLSENFFFCPNCGKKVKDSPLSTTVGKQIGIYLLSFLLPPLGLFPGIKYISQKDKTRRMIGFAAISLTILSIIITIWLTVNILSTLNTTLNTQMNQI